MVRAAVDEVAFLYLLRTMELEPGRTYRLDRHFDASRNPVSVEVAGRREVETPGGTYPVLALRPVMPGSDAFSRDAGAELLLSDDDRRIVVQLRSRTKVGPVTLRLREAAYPSSVVVSSRSRRKRRRWASTARSQSQVIP